VSRFPTAAGWGQAADGIRTHDLLHGPPATRSPLRAPSAACAMIGRTARVTFMGPMRLTASWRSICSGVSSSKKPASKLAASGPSEQEAAPARLRHLELDPERTRVASFANRFANPPRHRRRGFAIGSRSGKQATRVRMHRSGPAARAWFRRRDEPGTSVCAGIFGSRRRGWDSNPRRRSNPPKRFSRPSQWSR
jgi:hypothetical protein